MFYSLKELLNNFYKITFITNEFDNEFKKKYKNLKSWKRL